MPLFEFQCPDCGQAAEILVMAGESPPACPSCGKSNLEKQLSAPSSYSGASAGRVPGEGDTSCCGSTPSSAGCAGPGSCCGKTF